MVILLIFNAMNSAVYVMKKRNFSRTRDSRSAPSIKRVTLKTCWCELLVCKFKALDFSRRFDVAVSRRGLFTKSQSVERLQSGWDFVMSKLRGNDGFWKTKWSKRSFVSDRERPLIMCFFFCRFISHLIGGYTIVMSKSIQSVYGFWLSQ